MANEEDGKEKKTFKKSPAYWDAHNYGGAAYVFATGDEEALREGVDPTLFSGMGLDYSGRDMKKIPDLAIFYFGARSYFEAQCKLKEHERWEAGGRNGDEPQILSAEGMTGARKVYDLFLEAASARAGIFHRSYNLLSVMEAQQLSFGEKGHMPRGTPENIQDKLNEVSSKQIGEIEGPLKTVLESIKKFYLRGRIPYRIAEQDFVWGLERSISSD
ncbi:MAG: hypothetical protein WC548_02530 [Candidatus Pacearchaeota archaeon]